MSKTIKKIDRIDEIAKHYGFKKIKIDPFYKTGNTFLHPRQKENILEKYKSSYPRTGKHFSMIYNNKPVLVNKINKNSKSIKSFNFDIIGVSDSIAEATIIHTAITSLKEEGYKKPFVHINSLGDKDSFINFKDNLFNFYKTRSNELHPKCQNFYKKDVFDLFLCNHRECKKLRKSAPRPIYFLSNKSQRHLKKTLEYLESMKIDYDIDDLLVSPHNHFSKIIFEIKHRINNSKEKNILLARGGRYDDLAKRVIRRRGVKAVGVSLEFPKKKRRILKRKNRKSPEFYFIQFGSEAKQKSLATIEMLRKSKLRIRQDLHIDKFAEQIARAKKLDVSYTLILGQKEILNKTIIVKDLKRASIKTVKQSKILDYLKQLK